MFASAPKTLLHRVGARKYKNIMRVDSINSFTRGSCIAIDGCAARVFRVAYFSLLCLSTSAPLCASTDDLFLAEMEDDFGKVTLHFQKSSSCMHFLADFLKRRAIGEKVQLTLADPPFTGYT